MTTIARLYGIAPRAMDEAKGENDGATGGRGDELKDDKDTGAKPEVKAEEPMIPKVRFDQAVGKEREKARAAETRARELEEKERQREAQQAAAADTKKMEADIDELEDKLEKAMTEGTAEDRKRIRGQIRQKEQALADVRAEAKSSRATASAVEQVRYDAVCDRMEAEYPFLNPGSDEEPNPEFNASITKDLLDLRMGFEAAGMSSSAALKRAEKILAPALKAAKAAKKEGDADAEADAEKQAAEAKRKAEEKEEAGVDRREKAVGKGLEAKGSQPPAKPGTVGTVDKNPKKVDPKKMSDKEYDALSDEDKRRARGDFAQAA